tara:strand:+ start:630 stop:752 length:123 start_codon:yes stop_codon:yes gene_type:complete
MGKVSHLPLPMFMTPERQRHKEKPLLHPLKSQYGATYKNP